MIVIKNAKLLKINILLYLSALSVLLFSTPVMFGINIDGKVEGDTVRERAEDTRYERTRALWGALVSAAEGETQLPRWSPRQVLAFSAGAHMGKYYEFGDTQIQEIVSGTSTKVFDVRGFGDVMLQLKMRHIFEDAALIFYTLQQNYRNAGDLTELQLPRDLWGADIFFSKAISREIARADTTSFAKDNNGRWQEFVINGVWDKHEINRGRASEETLENHALVQSILWVGRELIERVRVNGDWSGPSAADFDRASFAKNFKIARLDVGDAGDAATDETDESAYLNEIELSLYWAVQGILAYESQRVPTYEVTSGKLTSEAPAEILLAQCFHKVYHAYAEVLDSTGSFAVGYTSDGVFYEVARREGTYLARWLEPRNIDPTPTISDRWAVDFLYANLPAGNGSQRNLLAIVNSVQGASTVFNTAEHWATHYERHPDFRKLVDTPSRVRKTYAKARQALGVHGRSSNDGDTWSAQEAQATLTELNDALIEGRRRQFISLGLDIASVVLLPIAAEYLIAAEFATNASGVAELVGDMELAAKAGNYARYSQLASKLYANSYAVVSRTTAFKLLEVGAFGARVGSLAFLVASDYRVSLASGNAVEGIQVSQIESIKALNLYQYFAALRLVEAMLNAYYDEAGGAAHAAQLLSDALSGADVDISLLNVVYDMLPAAVQTAVAAHFEGDVSDSLELSLHSGNIESVVDYIFAREPGQRWPVLEQLYAKHGVNLGVNLLAAMVDRSDTITANILMEYQRSTLWENQTGPNDIGILRIFVGLEIIFPEGNYQERIIAACESLQLCGDFMLDVGLLTAAPEGEEHNAAAVVAAVDGLSPILAGQVLGEMHEFKEERDPFFDAMIDDVLLLWLNETGADGTQAVYATTVYIMKTGEIILDLPEPANETVANNITLVNDYLDDPVQMLDDGGDQLLNGGGGNGGDDLGGGGGGALYRMMGQHMMRKGIENWLAYLIEQLGTYQAVTDTWVNETDAAAAIALGTEDAAFMTETVQGLEKNPQVMGRMLLGLLANVNLFPDRNWAWLRSWFKYTSAHTLGEVIEEAHNVNAEDAYASRATKNEEDLDAITADFLANMSPEKAAGLVAAMDANRANRVLEMIEDKEQVAAILKAMALAEDAAYHSALADLVREMRNSDRVPSLGSSVIVWLLRTNPLVAFSIIANNADDAGYYYEMIIEASTADASPFTALEFAQILHEQMNSGILSRSRLVNILRGMAAQGGGHFAGQTFSHLLLIDVRLDPVAILNELLLPLFRIYEGGGHASADNLNQIVAIFTGMLSANISTIVSSARLQMGAMRYLLSLSQERHTAVGQALMASDYSDDFVAALLYYLRTAEPDARTAANELMATIMQTAPSRDSASLYPLSNERLANYLAGQPAYAVLLFLFHESASQGFNSNLGIERVSEIIRLLHNRLGRYNVTAQWLATIIMPTTETGSFWQVLIQYFSNNQHTLVRELMSTLVTGSNNQARTNQMLLLTLLNIEQFGADDQRNGLSNFLQALVTGQQEDVDFLFSLTPGLVAQAAGVRVLARAFRDALNNDNRDAISGFILRLLQAGDPLSAGARSILSTLATRFQMGQQVGAILHQLVITNPTNPEYQNFVIQFLTQSVVLRRSFQFVLRGMLLASEAYQANQPNAVNDVYRVLRQLFRLEDATFYSDAFSQLIDAGNLLSLLIQQLSQEVPNFNYTMMEALSRRDNDTDAVRRAVAGAFNTMLYSGEGTERDLQGIPTFLTFLNELTTPYAANNALAPNTALFSQSLGALLVEMVFLQDGERVTVNRAIQRIFSHIYRTDSASVERLYQVFSNMLSQASTRNFAGRGLYYILTFGDQTDRDFVRGLITRMLDNADDNVFHLLAGLLDEIVIDNDAAHVSQVFTVIRNVFEREDIRHSTELVNQIIRTGASLNRLFYYFATQTSYFTAMIVRAMNESNLPTPNVERSIAQIFDWMLYAGRVDGEAPQGMTVFFDFLDELLSEQSAFSTAEIHTLRGLLINMAVERGYVNMSADEALARILLGIYREDSTQLNRIYTTLAHFFHADSPVEGAGVLYHLLRMDDDTASDLAIGFLNNVEGATPAWIASVWLIILAKDTAANDAANTANTSDIYTHLSKYFRVVEIHHLDDILLHMINSEHPLGRMFRFLALNINDFDSAVIELLITHEVDQAFITSVADLMNSMIRYGLTAGHDNAATVWVAQFIVSFLSEEGRNALNDGQLAALDGLLREMVRLLEPGELGNFLQVVATQPNSERAIVAVLDIMAEQQRGTTAILEAVGGVIRSGVIVPGTDIHTVMLELLEEFVQQGELQAVSQMIESLATSGGEARAAAIDLVAAMVPSIAADIFQTIIRSGGSFRLVAVIAGSMTPEALTAIFEVLAARAKGMGTVLELVKAMLEQGGDISQIAYVLKDMPVNDSRYLIRQLLQTMSGTPNFHLLIGQLIQIRGGERLVAVLADLLRAETEDAANYQQIAQLFSGMITNGYSSDLASMLYGLLTNHLNPQRFAQLGNVFAAMFALDPTAAPHQVAGVIEILLTGGGANLAIDDELGQLIASMLDNGNGSFVTAIVHAIMTNYSAADRYQHTTQLFSALVRIGRADSVAAILDFLLRNPDRSWISDTILEELAAVFEEWLFDEDKVSIADRKHIVEVFNYMLLNAAQEQVVQILQHMSFRGAANIVSAIYIPTLDAFAILSDTAMAVDPEWWQSILAAIGFNADEDAGRYLTYNALMDVDNDRFWEPQAGMAGAINATEEHQFALPNGVRRLQVSHLNHAYYFDGTGGGGMASLQGLAADPTESSAAFELWLRPDSLPSGDEQHVLFESGGAKGAGVALTLSAEAIALSLHSAPNRPAHTVSYPVRLDLTQFSHVVGVIDTRPDSGDYELRMYLNGEQVAQVRFAADRVSNNKPTRSRQLFVPGIVTTSRSPQFDWSDNGGCGLGGLYDNDHRHHLQNFTGWIREFHFHNRVLGSQEVMDLYRLSVPVPTDIIIAPAVAHEQDLEPNALQLTWNAVSTAGGYHIYRNEDPISRPQPDDLLTSLSGRASTTYVDTDVVPGKVYYYWITSHAYWRESDFSEVTPGVLQPKFDDDNGGVDTVDSIDYAHLASINAARARGLIGQLYNSATGAQASYLGLEDSPIVKYGRVWIYDAGITLSLAVQGGGASDADKRAQWLKDNARYDDNGTFTGWPFSINQRDFGDNWEDVRHVTGANAWALHGIAEYVAEGGGGSEYQQFYAEALSGLMQHRKDNGLFSAGFSVLGLNDPGKYGVSYNQLLSILGDWQQIKRREFRFLNGIDEFLFPFMTVSDFIEGLVEKLFNDIGFRMSEFDMLREKKTHVVTEHCIDVLDLLNYTLEHYNELAPLNYSRRELNAIRMDLRNAIFEHLYKDGRFVTGDSSSLTAIDNSTWLCSALNREQLGKRKIANLASGLNFTIENFVKPIEVAGQAYWGAHYFTSDFTDRYIQQGGDQEAAYHIEATTGLIVALNDFADSYPLHASTEYFRAVATMLWREMQVYVNRFGLPYSSLEIQDLFSTFECTVSAVWFLQTYQYYQQHPEFYATMNEWDFVPSGFDTETEASPIPPAPSLAEDAGILLAFEGNDSGTDDGPYGGGSSALRQDASGNVVMELIDDAEGFGMIHIKQFEGGLDISGYRQLAFDFYSEANDPQRTIQIELRFGNEEQPEAKNFWNWVSPIQLSSGYQAWQRVTIDLSPVNFARSERWKNGNYFNLHNLQAIAILILDANQQSTLGSPVYVDNVQLLADNLSADVYGVNKVRALHVSEEYLVHGNQKSRSAYAALDADFDGLYDKWEIEYFGSVGAKDGLDDSDGDGQSDLDEFITGNDPTDNRDKFHFSVKYLEWQTVQLTFTSNDDLDERRYEIFFAADRADSENVHWIRSSLGVILPEPNANTTTVEFALPDGFDRADLKVDCFLDTENIVKY